MTAFKNTKDTLSTDFLLIWLFCALVAIFIEYPLISCVLILIIFAGYCYEEPNQPVYFLKHLKAACFGILSSKEEEIEESIIIKEEEENEDKNLPPGRFRFAKLLLTNQVPLMANYFEQRSQ
jgi:hypothetical protein